MTLSTRVRVGWIGTGVMGAPMCEHLRAAGCEIKVNTRTRARAEPLLAAGACWAASPAEAARDSDVVFTILGYPADVREVVLGSGGVLEGARAGAVLVDMTTSTPALAREISEAAGRRDVASLDAPVSGGDVGAREARLSIMVGGPALALERVRPLLEKLGQTIVHQGPAGSGQHTKAVNQTLVAASMIGVCEALLYAHRAGLDLETVLASVSSGAAGSWTLSNLAPRIVAGNFDPGFFVEHFVKDMRIALDAAREMSLSMPGLALVHQLYTALMAQGHGRKGTHALMLAMAELNGAAWAPGSD